MKNDPDEITGVVFVTLIGFVVLALLGLGVYSIVQSIRSNGEIDYCYTETKSLDGLPPAYQLWGHRPWRNDRLMGTAVAQDDIMKLSQTNHCPSLNSK